MQQLRRASTALSQILGPIYRKQASMVLTLAGQDRLRVDCTAFTDLLVAERAQPLEARTLRISLLEEAIKLYSGDFLPDEESASWAQKQRQELRTLWTEAMLALADLYRDEQRFTTAIDLLNQLLASDSVSETAAQRLMLLLAHQQRRIEAVQVYQRLTTILRTTHQAAPSPETLSLFRAIQQGDETLFMPPVATNDAAHEIDLRDEETGMRAKQKDRGLPTTQTNKIDKGQLRRTRENEVTEQNLAEIAIGRANQSPLVGRDPEVSVLYHLLEQIESRQGAQAVENNSTLALLPISRKTPRAHCIVLLGEAGIGKTRLAEESAREALRRGWTVVLSRIYPQEQGIPYRLWTAALRNVLTYLPEQAHQITEVAPPAIYQPLRALVPEMQEKLINAGGREGMAYDLLSPEQEELRLREAVYTFLTTLSLTSPLLLVLDDLQWADDSSAQMLGYLTRRMAEHPIMILATCRETELTNNRVLNNLIAHMQREQVVDLLHVQPLSDEQIGTLVSSLVSHLPAPAIAHIQNQVAGNPFFAEELVYSLQTSPPSPPGLPPTIPSETRTLPGTIAAALNQRLNRLSNECQDLLKRAAVLGGSFGLRLIAAMEAGGRADDDEDAVLDLLDEALYSGVLTEEGVGERITYHFWHPMLASHLYNELTATRRAVLHRRIADVLRQLNQTHESEEAATIAQHLVRGGAEPARIAYYAELAAHHAYSLFAYSEAEHYYRMALNNLAPTLLAPLSSGQNEQLLLPQIPLERRLHLTFLVERLAECARVRGNFQDAPTFYLRAIQLRTLPPRTFATPAEERQEAQIVAILWSEIAWIWRFTGDTAAARNCTERGEEVLQKAEITDGPAWGSLRHQQASLYWLEGYHQEALQASQQALDLFTTFLGRITPEQRKQDNLPAAQQTRAMRTLLGDPVDLGRVHSFLGIIYAAIGQLNEGLKYLKAALAIYEQHDRRREVAHVCCNIGHIHLLRAEYAEAHSYFERPLSYVEQSGDIPLKSVLLYNMGELATVHHQLAEAEKFYREGLALAERIQDREYLSTWNAILGALLQEQGRFKEAATAILRALAIGRATPANQPCIGFALVALANLRCALVTNASATETAQGRRALQHAKVDLQRALRLRGLDAEKRTQAQLAQAQVSYLLGNSVLAREQTQMAYTNAHIYELRAIAERCQSLLTLLPKT
jgi:predicted ATPase/DNA-binding SARP family transcriptional activator